MLRVVDRDIADSMIADLSADRRFSIAYSAALLLATIALRTAGYRTVGTGHHWITFHVLPEIMGDTQAKRADYFDHCRAKRNTSDYDRAGAISEREVAELIAEAQNFRKRLLQWIGRAHPDLLNDPSNVPDRKHSSGRR